jgi:hypothetical protein
MSPSNWVPASPPATAQSLLSRRILAGWRAQIVVFALLFGLCPAPATAQSSVEFDLPITVTDGVYTTTLTIGMRDGARPGRDEFDRAAPPPPPAGAFDARLIGPGTAYFTDVRPPTDEPVDFEVAYQASAGAGPIELRWSPDRLSDYGSFEIVDRFESGSVAVDMTETGRLDTTTEALLADGLLVRVTARSTPLPVELSSFVGRQIGGGAVRLQWRTQSETNNAGFAVEQRPDAGPFRQVAFVPGVGTTSRPQDYRHRVEGVRPGTHVFRLRQVDHDGSFAYSKPVRVQVNVEGAVWMQGPAPNPSRGRVRLELAVETAQQVVVETYDLLGRRVHRAVQALPAHRMIPLDLDFGELRLPSGPYFVHVRGETFSETKRVILLR